MLVLHHHHWRKLRRNTLEAFSFMEYKIHKFKNSNSNVFLVSCSLVLLFILWFFLRKSSCVTVDLPEAYQQRQVVCLNSAELRNEGEPRETDWNGHTASSPNAASATPDMCWTPFPFHNSQFPHCTGVSLSHNQEMVIRVEPNMVEKKRCPQLFLIIDFYSLGLQKKKKKK